MTTTTALKETFIQKAEAVSAIVKVIGSPDEAYAYALDICEAKEACQLLVSGCEEGLSEPAADLCQTKPGKIIAAPGLDAEQFELFQALCQDRGVTLLSSGMRKYLGGVDIGLTFAKFGIAETGSLVINSNSEEVRLATMVSEIHIAVLPMSEIRTTALDIASDLETMTSSAANYTAIITGASRTADIERVLALGVHGPLELHILLVENA
ncbi:lactate utilization protein [Desulfovibrio inopinatus]|uniref:lactate utilization protein n=1 Tax=Desulfovibrio inopinatus TaxID=102109 RepID=UPI00041BD7EC|nr:lactate utilization protein [Desulfovibrio inopinatus]